MNLPKTRRVGYITVTLNELSNFMNGELRIPIEYRPVVAVSIHKQEGKHYTEEPTFVIVLASEKFDTVQSGGELPYYSMKFELTAPMYVGGGFVSS